jgi:TonB-dependent SusC/RagA subfamily outer membrane receptor
MRYLTLAATLLLICFTGFSQERNVSGKVLAFGEIPVNNATVMVQGTGQKFYTDSLGIFNVSCSTGDRLIVTAGGFLKKNVRVGKDNKELLVSLILSSEEDAKERAVGYGHVKDKDKLYAIASHDESSIQFSHYRSIYEILETNFTGVQVVNNEVVIRSSNSFSGVKPALLIVDGREVSAANFAAIATNEISKVDILKDGSAAVYGVRGANGVVIVETKRGGK